MVINECVVMLCDLLIPAGKSSLRLWAKHTIVFGKWTILVHQNQNNLINGHGISNSLHHDQTIHPTENFILLILFKVHSIVTWSQSLLTSGLMEAVRGQKPSSEGQKSMKEWIFWNKVLIKVVQWPQKRLAGLIILELWPQMRKIWGWWPQPTLQQLKAMFGLTQRS